MIKGKNERLQVRDGDLKFLLCLLLKMERETINEISILIKIFIKFYKETVGSKRIQKWLAALGRLLKSRIYLDAV